MEIKFEGQDLRSSFEVNLCGLKSLSWSKIFKFSIHADYTMILSFI